MNDKKAFYVRVHDKAGNEFICPIEALKNSESATEEELDQCVDDGTVGRYAGNIKVVEPEQRTHYSQLAAELLNNCFLNGIGDKGQFYLELLQSTIFPDDWNFF